MRNFLRKILIISIPFIIFLIILIYIDPYKIIWEYKTEDYNEFIIPFNKDVVSTRLLIENNKTIKYNSFIIGSSMSQAFETNYWKQYLREKSSIFHLSAYDENLIGTYGKLKLADELGLEIKNVLWILDVGCFSLENINSNVARKHYLHTNKPVQFHLDYLKSFTKIKFSLSILDYSIFSTHRKYMGSYIIDNPKKRNLITNDQDYQDEETFVKKDSLKFYNSNRLNKFVNRKPLVLERRTFINSEEQKKLFLKINSILKKHKTTIKIIIPPSYEEFWLSNTDVKFLNDVFGKKNIYNFSGRNEITKSIGNFIDESHFRTKIAEQLIDSIYTK